MPTPVQSPAGRKKPGADRPNKSLPLGAEYLARPKTGEIAPFLRDPALLPRKPPTRTGRP